MLVGKDFGSGVCGPSLSLSHWRRWLYFSLCSSHIYFSYHLISIFLSLSLSSLFFCLSHIYFCLSRSHLVRCWKKYYSNLDLCSWSCGWWGGGAWLSNDHTTQGRSKASVQFPRSRPRVGILPRSLQYTQVRRINFRSLLSRAPGRSVKKTSRSCFYFELTVVSIPSSLSSVAAA